MGDSSACIRPEAAEMRAGVWRVGAVVVPGVGPAKSRTLIVFVNAAMENIGAALGHDRDLAAGATGKVRSLIRRRDGKLFDASDGDGNDGRGRLVVAGAVHRANSAGGVGTEAL